MAAADPLDEVLRLVSEGRISADEAAPILAALDAAATARDAAAAGAGRPAGASGGPPGPGEDPAEGAPGGAAPTSLRIEIRDSGRSVVNLRLPIAVGRFALDRVPGISGDQADRVREALREGMRGPVLVVDDGDSGVLITLE